MFSLLRRGEGRVQSAPVGRMASPSPASPLTLASPSAALLPLKLLATGKALPAQLILSSDLDRQLHRPPGWVQDKSGVRSRHHACATDTQSGLAALALRDAMDRGGIDPGSIDLLLSASGVPEQALPTTACRVLEPAGLSSGTPAFDVNASCLGFLAALQLAAALLNAGTYRRIAIVASDLASRGVDWREPEASLIFGDGAAAVVVERGDGDVGIEAYLMRTHPQGKALCEVRAGGTRCTPSNGAQPEDFLFRMDGKGVFRLTSQVIGDFLDDLFDRCPFDRDDIDLIVPHQASHLAMQHIRKRLQLPASRVVDIYATHGNQVAASLPTALHEAAVGGRWRPGMRVLLIGSAAGLTLGAMVLHT
ncbi:3-oxoacyl-[acyl-carrier-protein] synthase III C-terminal domain-containing protein [Ideonella sp. DXS29W]|uniref:3-oxoacyl-[acyl-carrier-protein] synthase III C-terminal domain-containing protein n=1 Tax=Ideonella lacteola TaxID=2984193 RepID=A0ABU9BH75_9BURK